MNGMSNGVASIHPGPYAGGYRMNVAGMTMRQTPGHVVGSTPFSASCSGDTELLKPALVKYPDPANQRLVGLPGDSTGSNKDDGPSLTLSRE